MTRDPNAHPTPRADVLGAVARDQIAARLRIALRLAEHGLPDEHERFEELLAQSAAHLSAWRAARPATTVGAQLAPTRFVGAAAEPVGAFLLIPFGDVRVERPLAGADFVFERSHAEAAIAWFERIGRKLAIDYEHQSIDRFNTRPDGLRPAAGWIGGLEVRDDGLWATDVTWTPRAVELLRSGEYRYFSPVIYWTDRDCTALAALGPVALTNDPAMHNVPALAAGRADSDDGGDDAPHLRARLDAAEGTIAQLRRQIELGQADAFVERGLRLGKISDATSLDWRDDYLRQPQAAEARLRRAPVILPQGRELEDASAGARREGDAAVDGADLDAFERAVAAGRVRYFGGVPAA